MGKTQLGNGENPVRKWEKPSWGKTHFDQSEHCSNTIFKYLNKIYK
jgi:hypothetical protein